MTTKPKLPDWTWQLEAGDMAGPDDKWSDWAKLCVGDSWGMYVNLMREIRRTLFNVGFTKNVYANLNFYQSRNTLNHNARVWNTTMMRLGYDIDEESCLRS